MTYTYRAMGGRMGVLFARIVEGANEFAGVRYQLRHSRGVYVRASDLLFAFITLPLRMVGGT